MRFANGHWQIASLVPKKITIRGILYVVLMINGYNALLSTI